MSQAPGADLIHPTLDPLGIGESADRFVDRFRGRPMVVKIGGHLLADVEVMRGVTEDIYSMLQMGMRPVVVHGGGPQITAWLRRLGLETTFKGGHRVTTVESLEITRMVLVGQLNREIVSSINRFGPVAVGLSGEDLGLLTVVPRDPDLGLVGEVTWVNTQLIDRLLDDGLVPVIATIGTDGAGQAYNVNADLGASAIGAAISAEKLIYLTDVDGILEDPSVPGSLLSNLTTGRLERLVSESALSGGMSPKAEAALQAVRGGVTAAHILNGLTSHVLLTELLTETGVGTMITKGQA